MTASSDPDFRREEHGSIVLLHPLTAAAREWLAEHCPLEEGDVYLGDALAVDPPCVGDLVDAIAGDGLSVTA
jgi:hypothetical protein